MEYDKHPPAISIERVANEDLAAFMLAIFELIALLCSWPIDTLEA